jgi:hypothetical protein
MRDFTDYECGSALSELGLTWSQYQRAIQAIAIALFGWIP